MAFVRDNISTKFKGRIRLAAVAHFVSAILRHDDLDCDLKRFCDGRSMYV